MESKWPRRIRVVLLYSNFASQHHSCPSATGCCFFGPVKKQWQKILTRRKRVTHGRGIDFPKFVKHLTQVSLNHCQFQSAFTVAGLYPQPTAAAIPELKLAPVEAVTISSSSPPQSCGSKTPASTPTLKKQLRHHFSNLFQTPATPKPKARPNPSSRVELEHYEEVMYQVTVSDEGFSLINVKA